MRRLLFLAYHFPPIGYSGVQRSVKFVRYLPEFGWRPVVVTGAAPVDSHSLPQDETLAAELPAELEVLRARGPEPLPSTGNRARAERWLRVSRPWSRWWCDEAAAAARSASSGVNTIFTSMSPFESARTATRLSAETGLPWIADLRDPWALDEMLVYPTWLHRRAEMQRMRRGLSSAAAIVMNTPEAAAAVVAAFPELRDRPVIAISNGFDQEDFSGASPDRPSDEFRIVHAGSFHTEAGLRRRTMRTRRVLGGTLGDVDFLTRSHVLLVTAVERLIAAEPELRQRIRLVFAGASTPSDRAHTSSVVEFLPYLPHAETVTLIRGADLLFLPMHDLGLSRRARIVPGKAYEYLATGRPILAAVPEGDARELLIEAGTGLVCGPADVDAIARIVREQIRRADAGEASPPPDQAVLARYERRELTRRLAELLDSLV